jgi:hypothetical protein
MVWCKLKMSKKFTEKRQNNTSPCKNKMNDTNRCRGRLQARLSWLTKSHSKKWPCSSNSEMTARYSHSSLYSSPWYFQTSLKWPFWTLFSKGALSHLWSWTVSSYERLFLIVTHLKTLSNCYTSNPEWISKTSSTYPL